jgi:hypothetical protein
MEARGVEPLTSGMQILRSPKLSYAPGKAGTGFEPVTFGL